MADAGPSAMGPSLGQVRRIAKLSRTRWIVWATPADDRPAGSVVIVQVRTRLTVAPTGSASPPTSASVFRTPPLKRRDTPGLPIQAWKGAARGAAAVRAVGRRWCRRRGYDLGLSFS